MNEPNDEPAFTVVYDSEEGEVVTHDFGIKRAIEVRQGLIDQAVRHAAIAELERLGYTVIPPEGWTLSIEYAPAEHGYEDDIVGTFTARGTAEYEVAVNKTAGLDSYLAHRTVFLGPWTESQS